jgi:cbb3-type cytochrome oxidase subunit 3
VVAEALMRGFRSTLILLVILIGLVGYIYFVESKKTTPPTK